MKKIFKIDFNLLIFLILCLFLGEAAAATEVESLPKSNEVGLFEIDEVDEVDEIAQSSIDIKNKNKGKKTRTRRGAGKVNFETFQQHYEKAMSYYNKKAFLSAARIFEQLYPLSIGTPLGDTILFLFADSYFQNRDFQMAAFHFKDYARRYPGRRIVRCHKF